MMRLVWINETQTALTRYIGESYAEVVEPGHSEWDVLSVQDGIQPYVPPPEPSTEELAAMARAKRNALLTASDWTQVPDAPVDRAAWATYRQALRDIPQQEGFPEAINWPAAPN